MNSKSDVFVIVIYFLIFMILYLNTWFSSHKKYEYYKIVNIYICICYKTRNKIEVIHNKTILFFNFSFSFHCEIEFFNNNNNNNKVNCLQFVSYVN